MCNNKLLPNIQDGRFFVSPILGCAGGCSYCYLKLNNYYAPRKNEISISEMYNLAQKSSEFHWGRNGTIISVGAWGDIFPNNNFELTSYSVDIICELLNWGNPVQIMSKNTLSEEYIKKISVNIKFPNQLLYSSTITSISHWRDIEPAVSSPEERLRTCFTFKKYNIPTNILLKPFIPGVTDVELEDILEMLLKFKIDFCTLGVMYIDKQIAEKIQQTEFLQKNMLRTNVENNYLDCNGEMLIKSTTVDNLIPYLQYIRKLGMSAFLKSSCVNANLLKTKNLSGYYEANNIYCIKCGCCECYNNKKH